MAYDIFGRVKNMVYTTSENYGLNVKIGDRDSYTDTKNVTISSTKALKRMGLEEDEALEVVMHAAAHEGGHALLSDTAALREVMQRARDDGENVKKLQHLVQIAEDYRVDSTISKDRPGYWQSRREAIKATSKMFKDRPSEDPTESFMKAVSFFTHDTDLRKYGWSDDVLDWDDAKDVAKELEQLAAESKSTSELLEKVYEYCKARFPKEPEMPSGGDGDDGDGDGEDSPDGGDTSKKSKKSSKKDKPERESTSESSDDVDGDTEDTEDDTEPDGDSKLSGDGKGGSGSGKAKMSDSDFEKTLREMEKSLKGKDDTLSDMLGDEAKKTLDKYAESSMSILRDKDELEKYAESTRKSYEERMYKSLWSVEERKKFENENCVGVHAGADAMYVESKRKEKSVEDSTLKRYDAQARKLGNMLLQVLKAEADEKGEITSSGSKLIANKMWKPIHTGNPNVFYKRDFTESGGYVLDLVLDASGSQNSREKFICIQAYIIAQACSIAGIPCRVTQFRNYESFTILERIRDFDEPEKANLNCGGFRAGGDNRDGLAIKIADYELQKRQEENKVMIVLSDGIPEDNSGEDKINAFGGLGRYRGRYYGKDSEEKIAPAVLDVCTTVRDIRNSGTALMGIYVGQTYNLETEKVMYGSDFAYIGTDTDKFVPVVMKYLVKHIQGLDK